MSEIAAAKSLVQSHYAALAGATAQTVSAVLAQRLSPACHWRGMRPFYEQSGPAAIAEAFWAPFLGSFSAVQRREDVFFGGANAIDGGDSVWTASMGHLMGLWDAPFLGVGPTRRIAMLRYAEFNRVEGGQIVETALFVDLLHLFRQAGVVRFPDQTAMHLVQPGPRTHDGVLTGAVEAEAGQHTLAVIDRMANGITAANADPAARTPRMEMQENWHDDMLWWGPEGIGATYTIDRYIEQHQRPFRTLMQDRVFNGHLAKIGEGNYGGFFGWPNLTLTNSNGYMGVPGNDIRADMRVVDIYRRAGDKLAENWVFIDVPHFLHMQGVDVLAECAAMAADLG